MTPEIKDLLAELHRCWGVLAERDRRIAELEARLKTAADRDDENDNIIDTTNAERDRLQKRIAELETANQRLERSSRHQSESLGVRQSKISELIAELAALKTPPKATAGTVGGTTVLQVDPYLIDRSREVQMTPEMQEAAAELEAPPVPEPPAVPEPFVSEAHLSSWEAFLRAQAGAHGWTELRFDTLGHFLKEIRRLQSLVTSLRQPVSVDTGEHGE